MARYLILPLILLLALVAVLLYVGNEQWMQLSLLASEPKDLTNNAVSVRLQAAILAGVVFVIALIALWSLLTWLWRLPRRVKTGFGRKRGENGIDALESALFSCETGNGENARKQAKRAADLLGRPALTGLVAAKAAEVAGDMEDAHSHYSTLLENPKTKMAGLHGLARLAFERGDYASALDTAQQAVDNPKSCGWAFDFLFKSQISLQDWAGALDSLSAAEKRKTIDKAEAKRTRSVLLAAQASGLEKLGETERAVDIAQQAHSASPEFAPASALAARLLHHNGDSKKAAHLIEKAWGQNPHPALALSHRDIFGNEPEKVQAKKVNGLIKTNPAHRESFILGAEEALRSNNGVEALQSLGTLLREGEPSARLCTLAGMAEDLLGNAIDARAWHLRAATAPIEADWSDLDPDGPAFNYTQSDWQRLVMSYGKTGELIHPRYESHAKRKPALEMASELEGPDINTPADNELDMSSTPPSPDDPEKLSERLDNLLDD
ncbi:MAG: heme biosynthesis protein HemY [Robiginitomaculum sp.]|nr:heme biosynthesis protein HemY [Robiginitomaculum sp.]